MLDFIHGKESLIVKIKDFENQFNNVVSDEIVEGVGRIYHVPSGNYPSVTTVLNTMMDKSSLEEWKQNIGEENANEIVRNACTRGSSMHSIIERYFLSESISKDEIGYKLFRQLNIYLRKIKFISSELALWSTRMRIAGRTDCIGIYDNEICIIDFKTSRHTKMAEQIESYFLQCSIYALMLFERTGVYCNKIVVLIATEDGFPQIFVRNTSDYTKKAVGIITKYHSQDKSNN